ncbi:hypothetical protein [Streptomyces litchfieldiae]|uniref:Aminoglycoside phosphotransferase domain-containing protein n=1 Tax=Streptomyces litchfieldiae TaxID=3075543 RepID=A0ABU2MKD1_9ACTN|nr:hypothetical protein [Streptomyces sp. DSM 44938]MDT0341833.1 hypothetical protein [Streptomyces sp. DSM 44938]
MSDTPTPPGARAWPRVPRLDPARTADALHAATGIRLTVEGPCPGGQVGTAYVRRPDGHRSVLKWRAEAALEELRAGPVTVTDTLRAAGYPVPATELSVQLGPAVVLVQELLPGSAPRRLDAAGLDRVLALNAPLAMRSEGWSCRQERAGRPWPIAPTRRSRPRSQPRAPYGARLRPGQ